MNLWGVALAVGLVSIAIRLLPEALLRGREPPIWIAVGLPWLPVAVAGTFVGVMHLDDAALRLEYVVAGGLGALTLLWRRTFYLPLVVGAVTLAVWRAAL
ncbi:MAG: AzlD domain-containing protein [Thermoplasmatota archaeon]